MAAAPKFDSISKVRKTQLNPGDEITELTNRFRGDTLSREELPDAVLLEGLPLEGGAQERADRPHIEYLHLLAHHVTWTLCYFPHFTVRYRSSCNVHLQQPKIEKHPLYTVQDVYNNNENSPPLIVCSYETSPILIIHVIKKLNMKLTNDRVELLGIDAGHDKM